MHLIAGFIIIAPNDFAGRYTILLSHEARLEDVIADADFSESVNVLPPVDESTIEEVPTVSELTDVTLGAVNFNGSRVHNIQHGRLQTCVGVFIGCTLGYNNVGVFRCCNLAYRECSCMF